MERSLIAGRKDNIVETYVTLESLGAMLQRVVSQDPSVTEMRVLGFELSNDDSQALAFALAETKTLKALSLDQLHIGDEGARQIAQGLCYNESLTYLSLRWNEIGPEGAMALAEALHYNKTIKHFIASFNNFSSGGEHFATPIKTNEALQTMDLKWNNIDNETDRKSTRLNSSHRNTSRMPSSA